MELGRLRLEQLAERADEFVAALAAHLPVVAGEAVLVFGPSQSGGEVEAAPRQHVEARDGPAHEHRVVQRQHVDADPEANPRGGRGHVGEHDHRVEERRLGREGDHLLGEGVAHELDPVGNILHQSGFCGSATCSPDHTDSYPRSSAAREGHHVLGSCPHDVEPDVQRRRHGAPSSSATGNQYTEPPVSGIDVLRDQVAVVTGGGGGIGRSAALALARPRCRRGDPRPRRGPGGRGRGRDRRRRYALVWPCPPTRCRRTPMRGAIADADERFGRIDILVNNVGGVRPRRFVDQSEESWRRHLEINLVSALVGDVGGRPGDDPRRSRRIHRQRLQHRRHPRRAHVRGLRRVQGGDDQLHPDDGARARRARHPQQRRHPRLDPHARATAASPPARSRIRCRRDRRSSRNDSTPTCPSDAKAPATSARR